MIISNPRSNVSLAQLAVAAILMSLGLGLLAGGGDNGSEPLGLDWLACGLPVIGGSIALFRTPQFLTK